MKTHRAKLEDGSTHKLCMSIRKPKVKELHLSLVQRKTNYFLIIHLDILLKHVSYDQMGKEVAQKIM
jgi:hypothetical protein